MLQYQIDLLVPESLCGHWPLCHQLIPYSCILALSASVQSCNLSRENSQFVGMVLSLLSLDKSEST
jgi:hypothetical protein